MKILVANLGSTSFKYRLFEMAEGEERLLGKGGSERVTDFGEAISGALRQMEDDGMVASRDQIEAVGFKTVLGRGLSGCVEAGDEVLEALDGFAEVAPAHNPAYAAGIRQFRDLLPGARRVALFETAFYQWMPEAATRYAVPGEWHEAGIRRYGFHGASHKFIAERSAELLGRDDVAAAVRRLYQDGPAGIDDPLRVISCHLGGSSSVTGIRNGVAVGTSMGFSPQSGLPQNNRVGDLDSGAIPYARKALGIGMEDIERQLTRESGLLGLSGVSNDLRDVKEAADGGNRQAALSLEVLVHEARRWASSFLFPLGGLEAFVFTAGIGENNPWLRAAVCAGLAEFGILIDPERNEACRGEEAEIGSADSRVKVLVIPANEELVLAREVFRKVTNLN
ncbi:MAG: acetate kinase [Akkermansiaceae bacterium]|nr:acetate kinase [Akkermansiaceae bacterium]NNM29462.1 acetate kinase [Akkermansiaceae bacterium]